MDLDVKANALPRATVNSSAFRQTRHPTTKRESMSSLCSSFDDFDAIFDDEKEQDNECTNRSIASRRKEMIDRTPPMTLCTVSSFSSSSCCSLCRCRSSSEEEESDDDSIGTISFDPKDANSNGDILKPFRETGRNTSGTATVISLASCTHRPSSTVADEGNSTDAMALTPQNLEARSKEKLGCSCRNGGALLRHPTLATCAQNYCCPISCNASSQHRVSSIAPLPSIAFPCNPSPLLPPPSHLQLSDSSWLSPSTQKVDYISSSYLPDEVLFYASAFLDVFSLARLRGCNKRMCDVASRDEAGWSNHCKLLWAKKANVCSEARDLIERAKETCWQNRLDGAMKAYKLSIHDASHRREITEEELCFDAKPGKKGSVFSFRFKESAGQDWTEWDPWWHGREARKMVFLKNGTVLQVAPSSTQMQRQSKTQGIAAHPNIEYKEVNGCTLQNPFSDAIPPRGAPGSGPPRIKIKWRFVKQPMDLPARPEGAYIRLTVGGRDVPTYVVHRSPTGNWGFVLESCWGVYASFDLPQRYTGRLGTSRAAGEGAAVQHRRRLRRTRTGGRWINVDGIESDSDDEEDSYVRNVRPRRETSLMDDSSMTVTNSSQWREALLYNFGAVTLPDGSGAMEEFDRVWNDAEGGGRRQRGPPRRDVVR